MNLVNPPIRLGIPGEHVVSTVADNIKYLLLREHDPRIVVFNFKAGLVVYKNLRPVAKGYMDPLTAKLVCIHLLSEVTNEGQPPAD